jgi:hypothetical protein
MQIFRTLFAAASLTFCIVNTALAYSITCPTPDEIRKWAAQSSELNCTSQPYCNYHINWSFWAPSDWSFSMDFPTVSLEEAQTKVQNALATLVQDGPSWLEWPAASSAFDIYACRYKNSEDVEATAWNF